MSQPGHNLPTLLQKRPLAPAPPTRFGTSKLSRPVETEQSPLSSSSSSDNEDGDMLLVPRTVPASGYAELEEDPEDAAEAEAEMEDAEENGGDRDEIIRSRVATSQEQMRTIIASLSPEQLQRYETFRRVGFPRPMIKKVGKCADCCFIFSSLCLGDDQSDGGFTGTGQECLGPQRFHHHCCCRYRQGLCGRIGGRGQTRC